ncbi:MAG: hypothetical protein ABIG44_09920, partial [Planctomycetota bacterium]
MIRVWVLIMCLSAVPLTAVATEPANQLLAHVPDGAGLVVVCSSLDKLVTGLSAFGREIGVDELAELHNQKLLEEFEVLDQDRGIDTGGPLLLAQYPYGTSPLVMVVAKDIELWKNRVSAKPLEDRIFRAETSGEPLFAGIAGNVLIIGDDLTSVRAALRADGQLANRFHKQADAVLARNDIVVYVELSTWRPMIETGVMAASTYMQMGMAMSGQADEAVLNMWKW